MTTATTRQVLVVMPVHTLYREEFRILIKKITGNLSAQQVSIRTGISDEYLRKIMAGKVPSESILERFAQGMNADLRELRIAAGYEESDRVVEAVENALRKVADIPTEAKQEILDRVREVKAKYYTGPETE